MDNWQPDANPLEAERVQEPKKTEMEYTDDVQKIEDKLELIDKKVSKLTDKINKFVKDIMDESALKNKSKAKEGQEEKNKMEKEDVKKEQTKTEERKNTESGKAHDEKDIEMKNIKSIAETTSEITEKNVDETKA